tara:strand:+ start:1196 stop:1405 length:210 start_codon:yes stop_codon:yes gene_type:complete
MSLVIFKQAIIKYYNSKTNVFDEWCPISFIMVEDWNDGAQSEKDGPKLLTQIILILVVAVMVMIFFLGM